MKKRTRLDIYADILQYLKGRPDGAQITKISYSAGLPLDRVKPMLQTLAHFDLLTVRVLGPPLQASMLQRRLYFIGRRGLEFLDAYKRIQGLITYLDTEQARESAHGAERIPMDYVGTEQG